MSFVEKFPLLVSASQCGVVSVFAVRGCPRKIRAHCLGRFLNVNREVDSFAYCPITSMTFEVVKNPRYNPDEKKVGALQANVRFFKDLKN